MVGLLERASRAQQVCANGFLYSSFVIMGDGSLFATIRLVAGKFQDQVGGFGCMSCDNLGEFYQAAFAASLRTFSAWLRQNSFFHSVPHGAVSLAAYFYLGEFHQEDQGQTTCLACEPNTRRYPGVLTAANKSSCMCKEGRPGKCRPLGFSSIRVRVVVASGSPSRPSAADENAHTYAEMCSYVSQKWACK